MYSSARYSCGLTMIRPSGVWRTFAIADFRWIFVFAVRSLFKKSLILLENPCLSTFPPIAATWSPGFCTWSTWEIRVFNTFVRSSSVTGSFSSASSRSISLNSTAGSRSFTLCMKEGSTGM